MEALRNGSRSTIRQLLSLQAASRTRTSTSFLLQSQTQSIFRTRPAASILQTRSLHLPTSRRPQTSTNPSTPILSRTAKRHDSSDANLDSIPEAKLSLSQRLKKLSREYGWAALYIYLGLSALDFPFCFLAVKLLGTDLIGHWEHVIVSNVKALLQWPISGTMEQQVGEAIDKVQGAVGIKEAAKIEPVEGGKRLLDETTTQEGGVMDPHGYKEAEKANAGTNASIWTQLALAYAIHKSFIFVRVPLTAAVTPKIVKTLRGWGWNIGRPKIKPKGKGKRGDVGVNTKGSKVKPDDD